MNALLALVRKDFALFFHDRRAVLFAFVMPIAIASFFGFLFSGDSGRETGKVAILAVDLDGSALSRAVVAGLAGDPALAVEPAELAAARTAVRKGKAAVAVVLPKGFGQSAARAFFGPGDKPVVDLLYDPSHQSELLLVRGVLTQHAMEAVSAEVFAGETGAAVLDEQLAAIESGRADLPAADRSSLERLLSGARDLNRSSRSREAEGGAPPGGAAPRGLSMPFTVKTEEMTARTGVRYNGYAHSFGGMGVQFVLFAAIDLGVGILLERQRGLWKRLRSAPISRGRLLGAKAISATLLGLLTLLVTFGFAMLVFGVRIEGSAIGFLGVALAFSAMAATFGLLIAAIGRTPPAARGISTLAVMLLVMLGGAWVPSFIFPAWLQKATLLTPTRWAVDGFDAMTWRGVGLAGAAAPIGVLLASALLFGALAWARFRWEES